jgi:myo-inositol-1(or 4)-monophosphatase
LREVCEGAARAGGEELLAWRGRFRVEEKAHHDYVTDADRASQQAVRQVIFAHFPDHGFLGEEDPHPAELDKPYCWVVDPLDGTTNYVHDFPFFAVSVAVAEAGRLVAATILDPLRNECFTALRGEGARLNGQPLAVSRTAEAADALVAVSFPPHTELDSPDVAAFLRVAPRCQAVRRTGSAALNLAYVACGRLDAHWAHAIHPWDSAAGVLLVEEAGGVVTDSWGQEFRLAEGNYFAASTAALHQGLLPLVTGGIEKNG